MSDSILRLGTRQSRLALAQSDHVAEALQARHPGLEVELVPIVTRGDREPGELAKLGGKGLFTQELEEGLLAGTLDLAVHSLKDLPIRLPDGLGIAAFPPRADPRDTLISEQGEDLAGLPAGAVLLTGSHRRGSQILRAREDLRVEGLRGNVDTRIRRWRESGHAGVILAQAGLDRLGVAGLPAFPLDPEVMVPAPGQGILGLEVKRGSRAEELCSALDDPISSRAAAAERFLVRAFGGDCTLPLAAWATESEGRIRLLGVLATPDAARMARGVGEGETPETAGEACLEALRRDGAEKVLAALGR